MFRKAHRLVAVLLAGSLIFVPVEVSAKIRSDSRTGLIHFDTQALAMSHVSAHWVLTAASLGVLFIGQMISSEKHAFIPFRLSPPRILAARDEDDLDSPQTGDRLGGLKRDVLNLPMPWFTSQSPGFAQAYFRGLVAIMQVFEEKAVIELPMVDEDHSLLLFWSGDEIEIVDVNLGRVLGPMEGSYLGIHWGPDESRLVVNVPYGVVNQCSQNGFPVSGQRGEFAWSLVGGREIAADVIPRGVGVIPGTRDGPRDLLLGDLTEDVARRLVRVKVSGSLSEVLGGSHGHVVYAQNVHEAILYAVGWYPLRRVQLFDGLQRLLPHVLVKVGGRIVDAMEAIIEDGTVVEVSLREGVGGADVAEIWETDREIFEGVIPGDWYWTRLSQGEMKPDDLLDEIHPEEGTFIKMYREMDALDFAQEFERNRDWALWRGRKNYTKGLEALRDFIGSEPAMGLLENSGTVRTIISSTKFLHKEGRSSPGSVDRLGRAFAQSAYLRVLLERYIAWSKSQAQTTASVDSLSAA